MPPAGARDKTEKRAKGGKNRRARSSSTLATPSAAPRQAYRASLPIPRFLILNGQRLTLDQAVQRGLQWHQAGQLDAAGQVYQAVLDLDPNLASAWQLLGGVHYLRGDYARAETCLKRAIALDSGQPLYFNNLAAVQKALEKLTAAEASCRRALALQPDYLEAYNNLGTILEDQERYAEAGECFERVLARRPDFAEGHYNLGNTFWKREHLDEAVACYRQALALKPDYAEAHNNLGFVFKLKGQYEDALACIHQSLTLRPDYAEAYCNLGSVLILQKRYEPAKAYLQQCLALKPDYPYAYSQLGGILYSQSQHAEAIVYYRRALELKPRDSATHSNLLFCLNYAPDYSPQQVYAEHRRFAKRFADSLRPTWRPHANTRDPHRQLKIGYVSGDFRKHSVAFFIEPVLARHDHEQFEIICYQTCPQEDEITRQIQSYADRWHTLVGLDDEAAAKQIREDRIDILVDLSGHTAYHRLLVFAGKPAPVQASWLGYLTTTGLTAMDYRITDAHADPPGPSEAVHSETLYRLPDGFLVFQPPAASPEVEPPPVLANGFVTFGSFNNFAKVTPAVIALWARVLHAVPGSRLLLKTAALGDPAQQERVRAWFAAHAIAPERLILLGAEADYRQHQARYHEVDIGLDPFPCNGGTTTCDALWMGVPVVTLAGDRFISRMGVSMAQNAGLAELIAATPDDYVALAARLAGEPGHLADWRQRLRPQLAASPLLDADRFTRNLEAAYRRMWQAWCARPTFGFAKAPAATPAAKPHCIQTESLRA
jgi:predicted O-linked N-acetylglucosamine transferase (SPINDLY family)